MKKREHLYTASKNVSWCEPLWKHFEGSPHPEKKKPKTTIWPSIPDPQYIS